MSTSPIGSSTNSQSVTKNGLAAMTSDQFLKVMMSELQNQDPLQPQDSGKLMDQVSSLRNIESQLQLEQKLSQLVLQDQIAAAGNLIGKMATGLDAQGQTLSGVVTSVRVENGAAILELDSGQALEMTRVTQIANAKVAPAKA
jgi:flagellar basal-body rod modification protein FlgD